MELRDKMPGPVGMMYQSDLTPCPTPNKRTVQRQCDVYDVYEVGAALTSPPQALSARNNIITYNPYSAPQVMFVD